MKSSPRIFQINISQGGVPKTAVSRAEVSWLGLVGDCHSNIEFHGGIDRALCLCSLEKILDLQEEGHSIFPGSTGENLTLVGLDWEKMNPGVRLQINEGILL